MTERDNQNGEKAIPEITVEERLEIINESFSEDIMKEMRLRKKQKKTVGSESLDCTVARLLDANMKDELINLVQTSDISVVDRTIEKLNSTYIISLLDLLVIKLEENPRKGNDLLRWIKAILLIHSTYLMSIPDLKTKFAFLHKLLDSRAKTYKKILKLNGRIDLVLAHTHSYAADASNQIEDEEKEEDSFESAVSDNE